MASRFKNGDGMSYYFKDVLQARNITVSNIQSEQATLHWTNGDGGKRVVFMNAENDGTPKLSQNTAYSANSNFGSGDWVYDEYFRRWYCVYNGAGDSVTVTGLNDGTEYRAMVFEYYGSPGSETYYRAPSEGNPANFWTLSYLDNVFIDVRSDLILETSR